MGRDKIRMIEDPVVTSPTGRREHSCEYVVFLCSPMLSNSSYYFGEVWIIMIHTINIDFTSLRLILGALSLLFRIALRGTQLEKVKQMGCK